MSTKTGKIRYRVKVTPTGEQLLILQVQVSWITRYSTVEYNWRDATVEDLTVAESMPKFEGISR